MHLIAAIDAAKPRRALRAPMIIWVYLLGLSLGLAALYRPQLLQASIPVGLGAYADYQPHPFQLQLATQTGSVDQAAFVPPQALPADSHNPQYPNHYAFGNCTWYVARLRPVPPGWGDARNWAYAAKAAGWTVSSTPQVGAIAWTPAGWVGHVAMVEAVQGNQVLITEMNNIGFDRIDERWVPVSAFKYIYE